MMIFIHRVNTITQLKTVAPEFGVEVDVRADGQDLVLNHEPFAGGERLTDYLDAYQHSGIIFNIKEAGIEQRVIDLAKQQGVTNYFLLDVEFPYLYRATRTGVRDIAIRYSEDESIETTLKYQGLVDWVWIDTNTRLPLDAHVTQQLKNFKTCLVCPERWGRPHDIAAYIAQLHELHFPLTAVMTAQAYAPQWQQF